MTWGHHTRTDGCWVKPPWWRGVWHGWFVIHTWICCVTARSREFGFPLHHAWHQALQSTYPQYTYRTLRPHACSRLYMIRPPKRRALQSKYHGFIYILKWQNNNSENSELQKATTLFPDRRPIHSVPCWWLTLFLVTHHKHTHTPSVTFDCCRVSTKNKLTQLLLVTFAAPLRSKYLSRFWLGWSHRTVGIINPPIGATAGYIYPVQEFLQYLRCRPITTVHYNNSEAAIEAGRAELAWRDVSHSCYPGPFVSGGVPVKAADKHVAGTQRPARRSRPHHLKGTVNQWETAEAEASLRTPENRWNKQRRAFTLCSDNHFILLTELSAYASALSQTFICTRRLRRRRSIIPDFAYGCIRDARRCQQRSFVVSCVSVSALRNNWIKWQTVCDDRERGVTGWQRGKLRGERGADKSNRPFSAEPRGNKQTHRDLRPLHCRLEG